MSDPAEGESKSGFMATMIGFVALMILAGAAGVGYRLIMDAPASPKAAPGATSPQKPSFIYAAAAPIITNIANPATVWIRLELTFKIDGDLPPPEVEKLTARLTEDTLAYSRTLSMADLEGATGLLHLREDLKERAEVRSNGKVKEVIIRSMVIQ